MWRGKIRTPFVTPEINPPGVLPRRISVPADSGFAQLITGALALLLDPLNYTETPGGLSTGETVQRMHEMFSEYLEPYEEPVTIPIGGIVPHLNTTGLPSGWLECNGAQYQAADYPALYAALPITLKQATTFNVPDMRLRVPVGLGAEGHAYSVNIGTAGGQAAVTLTQAQLPAHSHSMGQITIPAHSALVPVRTSTAGWSGGGGTIHMHSQTTVTANVAAPIAAQNVNPPDTNQTGGGQSHSNIQPFVVTMYAIRAE